MFNIILVLLAIAAASIIAAHFFPVSGGNLPNCSRNLRSRRERDSSWSEDYYQSSHYDPFDRD
jgi:hypothetical protein